MKTQSGRILVRNRRFLRHCNPASLCASVPNPGTSQHQKAPSNSHELTPDPLADQPAAQEPHRSDRPHRPPQRLIEDPAWP